MFNVFSETKKILILCIIAALFISCEQSVSPKNGFSEKYVLYCVLNSDTTFQKAYLSKSYDSDTYNPLDNTTDPSVEGAQIKLIINGSQEIALQEGLTTRTDTSRYTTPLKYYYTNGYKPADLDSVRIEAVLSNGLVLRSSLAISPVSDLYKGNMASILICNPSLSAFEIKWKYWMDKYNTSDYFYYARLDLIYAKADAPSVKYKISFPQYFYKKEDLFVPVYQGVTNSPSLSIYTDSFQRILEKISEGDENKSNYIIYDAVHTLYVLEKNLANYISAEAIYEDEFSARIDAADISNIENGLGLFGAFAKRKVTVRIAASYIDNFGYLTAY